MRIAGASWISALLSLTAACSSMKIDTVSPTDPDLAKRIATSDNDRQKVRVIFHAGGSESLLNPRVEGDKVCGETFVRGGNGVMNTECFEISSLRAITVTSQQFDVGPGATVATTLGICVVLLPLCMANSIPGQ